jgi:hypothetical protein
LALSVESMSAQEDMAELLEITFPAFDRRTPRLRRIELMRRVIELRERHNMPMTQRITLECQGQRGVREHRVYHELLARWEAA